jgi:hypothetical protein
MIRLRSNRKFVLVVVVGFYLFIYFCSNQNIKYVIIILFFTFFSIFFLMLTQNIRQEDATPIILHEDLSVPDQKLF